MTKTHLPPSRVADQFVVRFPAGLRDQIAEAAKTNNRSMNAEIVARLQGHSSQGTDTLIQVIARQNADLAERDLELHAKTLQATTLAQTLRVVTDLLAKSDFGTEDNFKVLMESAKKLYAEFPSDYEELRNIGAKKLKKYEEANAQLISQIQASPEIPMATSQVDPAVRRILRNASKKTP